MKKLFLVDAYALIFKYYYAFLGRPMRNREGMNTSVVFGFVKFLRDIQKRERPDLLGVAFDPKGGSFCQDIWHLSNRSWEKCSNSFFRDMGSPVGQALRICIIGVKSIGTMGMDVNKSRKNTVIFPVFIAPLCAPWQNLYNFLIFHLDLCRNKLTGDPDPFTL